MNEDQKLLVESNLFRQLATLGDPVEIRFPDKEAQIFTSFRDIGLSKSDVSALTAIAELWMDEDFVELDWETSWTPIHAWRALAFLNAAEAASTLLKIADHYVDDWHLEEFPYVFAHMGLPAIPALDEFLSTEHEDCCVSVLAAHGLTEIAKKHETARDAVAQALKRHFASYESNDASLNAFLADYLTDLDVKDEAENIERAYADGYVDESVVSWWDLKSRLGVEGIGLMPENPPPRKSFFSDYGGGFWHEPPQQSGGNAARKKKRKAAKAARKKNRKRR
jgi:predicted DNA-binding protein YlxM (UPF0122 family)